MLAGGVLQPARDAERLAGPGRATTTVIGTGGCASSRLHRTRRGRYAARQPGSPGHRGVPTLGDRLTGLPLRLS